MKKKQKLQELTDADVIALAKAGDTLALMNAGETYVYSIHGSDHQVICPMCSQKIIFWEVGPIVCAHCEKRFVVIVSLGHGIFWERVWIWVGISLIRF